LLITNLARLLGAVDFRLILYPDLTAYVIVVADAPERLLALNKLLKVSLANLL
jgi:hypothetical protein